jgi:hypothetical protein
MLCSCAPKERREAENAMSEMSKPLDHFALNGGFA